MVSGRFQKQLRTIALHSLARKSRQLLGHFGTLPPPVYRRLQEIADQHDCSLSDLMQKAAEFFTSLDCDGDFLRDLASFTVETDRLTRGRRPG